MLTNSPWILRAVLQVMFHSTPVHLLPSVEAFTPSATTAHADPRTIRFPSSPKTPPLTPPRISGIVQQSPDHMDGISNPSSVAQTPGPSWEDVFIPPAITGSTC